MFAQNSTSSREEERLNILEQVKKDLNQHSVYRKIQFDIDARQVPFSVSSVSQARVVSLKEYCILQSIPIVCC